MAAKYSMKLTTIGQSKVALALNKGPQVVLAQIAVGDANGVPYDPTGGETALVHECARVSLEALAQDPQNPPWARTQGIIPAATGGFTISEVGVFDTANALIAIGRFPDAYKPLVTDGAAFDLPITCILQVGSTSSVTIQLDPSSIYATRDWVLAAADYIALSGILNTPPASPVIGRKYMIGSAPTGIFAGKAGYIAIYRNSTDGWLIFLPAVGARAGLDGSPAYRLDSSGWRLDLASVAEHLALPPNPALAATPAGVAAMIAAGQGRRRPATFLSQL